MFRELLGIVAGLLILLMSMSYPHHAAAQDDSDCAAPQMLPLIVRRSLA
jgi:hypothetical protein